MKRSKLIAGLSMSFMAAIALASCSLIKSNGHVVLKIGDTEYTAEDLFKDQKSAAAGEAKFNAVYKVAVRQYFTKAEQKSKLEQIDKDAKNKVSGQKDIAQSNANKNGTSYETEWNKILSSNNVEDEQGLFDKFEYELEKSEFDDQFYEKNLSTLKNGGYLDKGATKEEIKVDGYLNKKQPYHVKHILVKVSAAADDPTTGEITEAEAIKLSTVIQELANGENFGMVAKRHSDDTGSKDNFGDLGIMDRDTSFVNEFKLGTYLYEAFFGSSTTLTEEGGTYDAKKARIKLFGDYTEESGTKYKEGTAGWYAENAAKILDSSGTAGNYNGLGQIPYEAALMLGQGAWSVGSTSGTGYADVDYTTRNFSKVTSDNKAKYYPRNVIFNKYFNKNNIMVITPRQLSDRANNYSSAKTIVERIIDSGTKRKENDKYKGIVNAAFAALDGFKETNKKNDDEINVALEDDNKATSKQVLRDTEGRTIFVFRSGTTGDSSYQGIHFVCIERSPFIGKEFETRSGVTTTKPTTSDEYFTYYYPGQEGGKYPTYDSSAEEGFKNTNKLTYVNYINDPETSTLKTRADAVKTKIKSHDSNLNTYVYKYLLKEGSIKFKEDDELAKSIENDINTWIERKIESTDYETAETWNKTWKTYYQKLEETTKIRTPVKIASNDWTGGTISEACAIAYANYSVDDATQLKALQQMFGTGGIFHE